MERVDDRPRDDARRRTRPTFASSLPVCALTLALASCAGEETSEGTIRVPQLRIGTSDTALSLAATDRIEARRRDDEVLASDALRREVWVRSRVPGSSDCARLGQTGDEPVSGDDKPFAGGFELIVDVPADGSVNPALALLDGLDAPDPVSLLVLWSVPYTPSGGDADEALALLDVAEYPLVIAGPEPSADVGDAMDEGGADDSADASILLTTPADDPAEAGMVRANPVEGVIPCVELETLTRDPDDDGVDTLDELNAGLPLDAAVGADGSTPLAIDDGVDVVVAGRGDRLSGEPLAPTWRLFRSVAPDGSRGGRLELPPIDGEGEPLGEGAPLELRIATATPDGSMLVEAAFPAGEERGEGALSMEITYEVPGEPPGQFNCLEGISPLMLSEVSSSGGAPTDPSEGAYRDASGGSLRLTVRCDSKMPVPSGRLSLPLVRVTVAPSDAGDDGTPAPEVWGLLELELFVHDAPPEPDSTSRP